MVTAGPPTRRRDEEERIILMKSRDRRSLHFIRIILSSSSSPDFSTKNVRIFDKYVIIWCHGGDHSKWSNFFEMFLIVLFNQNVYSNSSKWKRNQMQQALYPIIWLGNVWIFLQARAFSEKDPQSLQATDLYRSNTIYQRLELNLRKIGLRTEQISSHCNKRSIS